MRTEVDIQRAGKGVEERGVRDRQTDAEGETGTKTERHRGRETETNKQR